MIPDPAEQPTMQGHAVAAALGCSYSTLLRAVGEGRSPVPFIRVGTRVTFPTAGVRAALLLDAPAPNGSGPTPSAANGSRESA